MMFLKPKFTPSVLQTNLFPTNGTHFVNRNIIFVFWASGSGVFCLLSSTQFLFLLFITWHELLFICLTANTAIPGSACHTCRCFIGHACTAAHLPQPFFFHYTPPLSLLPTGNRWEVKGVTCRGNGLLPLACQRVITCSHPQSPGGEEKLSWQPLQVPSKCAHTCGPPSWWEPRSATSYPIVSLPIIINTQLTHKYYSPYFIKSSKKNPKNLTLLIQQLSVISAINWC